ncbi:MAG: LysR substrate-binding domain-containing protein [Cupriavidus necator]
MRKCNIAQLRLFRLYFQYRDTHEVAAQTGKSASTIRYQLDRLRELTGDPLFLPNGRTLVPTQVAYKFFKIAGQILKQWEDIVPAWKPEAATSAQVARTDQELRIGVSPSLGEAFIAGLVARLCDRIAVPVVHASPIADHQSIVSDLVQGRLHSAFVASAAHMPPPELRAIHLAFIHRHLIGKDNVPVSATDSGRNWILLPADASHTTGIDQYLDRRAGWLRPRRFYVASPQAQLSLLHQIGGISPILDTVFPSVSTSPGVRLLPIPPGFPRWAELQCWHHYGSSLCPLREQVLEVGRELALDMNRGDF